MARLLRMPEIAANTVEAVLSQWPLAENAHFAAGDAIATVETDKAVVDVPADADGVLLRTLVKPGKSVSVGGAIAVLAEPGEVIDDVDAVVARLTRGAGADVGAAPGRLFASPLARRLAKENGLSVADIRGSGPGARIVRDDVHRAIAQRTVAAPEPEPPAASQAPNFHDIRHTTMRRTIASRLVESSRSTPVFAIRGSARVDRLLALRAELGGAGLQVSINDLVIAAAARAHVAVPEMNVIWTPDAVRTFHTVAIAIAVATDTGLVTPVLHDVPAKTLSALAAERADLVARARTGSLRQHELEGGTLTVTNLGPLGTEDFTAVINPPQAAILAVGATRTEPVVTDGELAIATLLRVTLTVDHRPVDGADAARWMSAFLALLEAPLRILA
jgi:pyruvate dehydrogenase E2 component (dihydrolipoamide acetyltransferase)